MRRHQEEPPPLPPDEFATITERPLPAHVDAERFVLAAILLDDEKFELAQAVLHASDFSIIKHQRIWRRICDIKKRGDKVDRVSLAEELQRKGELELIDGLSYLANLDTGMPPVVNVEVYVKIIRDKATIRRVVEVCRKYELEGMAQGQSADELLGNATADFAKLQESTDIGASKVLSPIEILETADGGYNGFFEPWRTKPAASTGYPSLDRLIYGFVPGQLYILAGNPGDGKTVAGLCFLENVASQGTPSLMFSAEMDRQALMYRLMCGKAGVSMRRFLKGHISPEERGYLREAFDYYEKLPIYVDDTPAISITELETRTRRAHREHGVKFGVMDYIQFMNLASAGDGETKFKDENSALTYISKRFLTLSRELGVIWVVLSQFNKNQYMRQKSDRRPQLNDLHGSGAMSKDASVVMALFREEKLYPTREELKGLVELIVLKHRNGPTGTVKLKFSAGYTRFVEVEPELFTNEEEE